MHARRARGVALGINRSKCLEERRTLLGERGVGVFGLERGVVREELRLDDGEPGEVVFFV